MLFMRGILLLNFNNSVTAGPAVTELINISVAEKDCGHTKSSDKLLLWLLMLKKIAAILELFQANHNVLFVQRDNEIEIHT